MDIDLIYRAADTMGKDIDIPDYIESNNYAIWETADQ